MLCVPSSPIGDITTLSLQTLETYAASTGPQYVKQLIEAGQARDWIAGRQLVDLLSTSRSACPPSSCAHHPAACAACLLDRVGAQ